MAEAETGRGLRGHKQPRDMLKREEQQQKVIEREVDRRKASEKTFKQELGEARQ